MNTIPGLGMFCTVARTELKEKVPNVSDETLLYLNHAIKQAIKFGNAELYKENERMKHVLSEIAYSKDWEPMRWLELAKDVMKELEGGKPT